MRIRIISLPAGEAPERVRQEWVGCEFPVVKAEVFGFGIFSHKPSQNPGYAVRYQDAVSVLGEKNPEAATYWSALYHPRYPAAQLIFDPTCCEVLPDY